MATTVRAIVATATAAIAAMPTSRSASVPFKLHKTNEPFDHSPISRFDGFEVVVRDDIITRGFGIGAQKEKQWNMVIRLGHSPYSTDDEREKLVADDISRLQDLVEAISWPSGTQLVVCIDPAATSKENAQWWVTELTFKVVHQEAIRTS